MLGYLESALFFVVGPVLWAAGLVLFVRSPLSSNRKVVWLLALLGVGIIAGLLLPFSSIRQKFVIVLLLLPVLAIADVVVMGSKRGFLFWLRACGFEVCTVFAAAAIARHAFEILRLAR